MSVYSNINKKYFDGKMKLCSEDKLTVNGLNYKRSLDRIIEKYSKLQHEDGAIEVDLSNTKAGTLKYYINMTKTKLKQMETQSSTDVSDESLRAHDISGDPEMDFSHEDGNSDDSNISSSQFSLVEEEEEEEEEEGEIYRIDTSQLPQRFVSTVDFQPEDQDKKLEMSLRSNTSLMELYPSMISRLEQAWHRHNVTEAADSVLRRYRKWRQQPQKSHLNNTFNVTLRHCRTTNTAGESSIVDVHPRLQSPFQVQRWSPGRGRSTQRRAQPRPAIVMDFSDASQPFKPPNCLLNETFHVPEQGEPSCSYTVSPPRLYPAKRLSLPHPERTDIYSSPARQSPFKTRKPSSPQGFTRSPKVCSPQGFSRELMIPRSISASFSSPHKSAQSATMMGLHRLRRHLSLDASLPLGHTSYSAKDLDEDFIKLYHKIVCQSKSSFFNRLPCRYCAKNPEASKNPSSSSLAALALSPHRSLLRKRAWEESLDSSPGSKRYRDESYASSPGSKRHNNEMLRRRLSLAEPAQPREHLLQPEPSGPGCSLQIKVESGCSPRSWR